MNKTEPPPQAKPPAEPEQQESTLIPMLIGGLVSVVIGLLVVMIFI